MMKSMKLCVYKASFVFVCFYRKGFYLCNEDYLGMYMILGVVTSLVYFIICCKNFYHYNEDHSWKI